MQLLAHVVPSHIFHIFLQIENEQSIHLPTSNCGSVICFVCRHFMFCFTPKCCPNCARFFLSHFFFCLYFFLREVADREFFALARSASFFFSLLFYIHLIITDFIHLFKKRIYTEFSNLALVRKKCNKKTKLLRSLLGCFFSVIFFLLYWELEKGLSFFSISSTFVTTR